MCAWVDLCSAVCFNMFGTYLLVENRQSTNSRNKHKTLLGGNQTWPTASVVQSKGASGNVHTCDDQSEDYVSQTCRRKCLFLFGWAMTCSTDMNVFMRPWTPRVRGRPLQATHERMRFGLALQSGSRSTVRPAGFHWNLQVSSVSWGAEGPSWAIPLSWL